MILSKIHWLIFRLFKNVFQFYRLCGIERDETTAGGEESRMWKRVLETHFQVLCQYPSMEAE
jgi:hypothetical protein